ncbi:hypothetical protein [Mucilaginibacter lacusdianchii]|uniref:hypothetical protein n=1 Tax=Mucilaginibacter lacusdianchii TaxID=2684211 RepID=UPI00131D7756|nr:hypothetical protein [Mucilaginibacter sp. JXJ CY 39]
MIKNIFNGFSFLVRFVSVAALLLSSYGFVWPVKPAAFITLQDERLAISPKEFYVASVVDNRSNTHAVAWLLADATVSKPQPIDLDGGAAQALKKYISNNIPVNTTLRPVIVHIDELKVIETALPGGRIEGKITINLSFDRKYPDDNVYLLSYKSSARYIRPQNQLDVVEPTLRRTLGSALIYLNTWMNKEADHNPKLAKKVKLSFTDYTDNSDPDTIYYTTKRPLIWNDFKAKPINGTKYAAEVFPSLAFDEEVEVVNSTIQVRIKMKVYLPKSASWVKPGYQDDYTLNHEQRHFDIAKIASEHYKRGLLTEQQPVTNYDGAIHADYLEAFRDMNRMQKQYDDETRHGLDQYAQSQWNERIDKELKILDVK